MCFFFFFSSICVDLLFLHGWNHDHKQFWAFHKGSSSLNWWHFKAGSFFIWEICFVECSLFSSLSGLRPLVSPLLSYNNQKPNIIKCPLRGKSVPTWELLPCRHKVREEGAVISPIFHLERSYRIALFMYGPYTYPKPHFLTRRIKENNFMTLGYVLGHTKHKL